MAATASYSMYCRFNGRRRQYGNSQTILVQFYGFTYSAVSTSGSSARRSGEFVPSSLTHQAKQQTLSFVQHRRLSISISKPISERSRHACQECIPMLMPMPMSMSKAMLSRRPTQPASLSRPSLQQQQPRRPPSLSPYLSQAILRRRRRFGKTAYVTHQASAR